MLSIAARAAAGVSLGAVVLTCSLAVAAPARAAACAGADDPAGSPKQRAAALHCLAAEARAQAHRPALRGVRSLKRSAAAQAATIDRCGTFTHTPCGKPMTVPMRRSGYARGCFTVGENLAWISVGATPREVLRAWLDSPPHRENLLDARFRHTGVAARVVTLADAGRVELWVQHFGRQC